jgi:hypothetical protein
VSLSILLTGASHGLLRDEPLHYVLASHFVHPDQYIACLIGCATACNVIDTLAAIYIIAKLHSAQLDFLQFECHRHALEWSVLSGVRGLRVTNDAIDLKDGKCCI